MWKFFSFLTIAKYDYTVLNAMLRFDDYFYKHVLICWNRFKDTEFNSWNWIWYNRLNRQYANMLSFAGILTIKNLKFKPDFTGFFRTGGINYWQTAERQRG